MDVSGSLAISLWNRDAHSLVRFGGALRVEQSACYLPTPEEEFAVGAGAGSTSKSNCTHIVARLEGHIDFTTAVDAASSPPRVCAMMVCYPYGCLLELCKIDCSLNYIRFMRTWRLYLYRRDQRRSCECECRLEIKLNGSASCFPAPATRCSH